MKHTITLADGKAHEIKFDFYAMIMFEEQTGKSLFSLGDSEFGITLLSQLTWAGLIHAEPELTIEQVQKSLLSFENMQSVSEIVSKAIESVMPKGKASKAKN